MKLMKGDMWGVYNSTDVFLFTGNSTLKHDDRLVMGRGLARSVRDKLPNTDLRIGNRLLDRYSEYVTRTHSCRLITVPYGICLIPSGYGGSVTTVGVFQVKFYFADKALLELIRASSLVLSELAETFPEKRFDVNFPGIGNGGLDRAEVLPVIEQLTDNVYVWELPQTRPKGRTVEQLSKAADALAQSIKKGGE